MSGKASPTREQGAASATFAVCIPNYNYARYLPDAVASVLSQETSGGVRVYVSDNASTDDSVERVRALGDDRVTVAVNPVNFGFAGNLDRAVGLSRGEPWIVMLSSDDLMLPGALSAYEKLFGLLGETEDVVVCSDTEIVDENGSRIGTRSPHTWLWRDVPPDRELSEKMGCPVRRQDAGMALAKALSLMRNPCYFVSTAYPRLLYEKVGGYRGDRLINPDKGFHWRLLSVASQLVYVEKMLFAYRVHGANQAAQQRKQGALKHLVDEYCYTFTLEDEVLARAGIDRERLEKAFVEHDVGLRGLDMLAAGDRVGARRTLLFGRAAYPHHARRNPWVAALRLGLIMGPLGTAVARGLRDAMRRRKIGEPQVHPTAEVSLPGA